MTLAPYGAFEDAAVELGAGLTVVLGPNESGKSTLLAAVGDLLWGFERSPRYAFVHARARLRVGARWQPGPHSSDGTDGSDSADGHELVRSSRGLLRGDEPVTAPWAQDGWDRGTWTSRLGLDHEQLRAGGRQVLRGDGDLAALVFSAHHGSGAQDLLAALEAEADRLWRPRGRSAVKDGVALVQSLDEQLAGTATRAGLVEAARAAAGTAREEADRAQERLRNVRARHEEVTLRLRLTPRARALLRTREQVAAATADLAGLGGALGPAEVADHDAAAADLAAARAALAELTDRAAALEDERTRCTVEADVLAAGAQIDALAGARQARAQDAAEALRARTSAEEAWHGARQALATLGPVPEGPVAEVVPDLLARLQVPADRAADLSGLAAAHTEVAAEAARAAQELDRARAATAGRDPQQEIAEEDVAALRAVVTAAGRDGSAARERRAALAARDERWAAARAEAVAAGALDPDAALEAPPALDPAAVRDAHETLVRARQEHARAAAEHDRCAAAARMAADELTQAQEGTGGVDEEALRTARARRDELLEPLRGNGSPADGSPADGTPVDGPAVLAAVAAADAAADALLDHAEATARLRELRRTADRAAAAAAAAAGQARTAASAAEAAQAAYAAAFTAAGLRVPDGAPAPVLAALERLDAERAAVGVHDRRARELGEEVRAQLDALTVVLARCAGPADVQALPAADLQAGLDVGLETARALVATAEAAAVRRALDAEHERAAQLAAQRCEDLRGDAARAEEAFRSAVAAAGLPADLGPAGWAERARVLRTATEAAEVARREQDRARDREDRVAAHADEVADLAARLGTPARADRPDQVEVALAALEDRLRRSRADERTATGLDRQAQEVAAAAAAERARCERAQARLGALAAEGEDPGALAGRARRSRDLLDLREREREETAALAAEVGRAEDVPALLEQTGARSDADLRTDEEAAALADEEAHEVWARAHQDLARAEVEVERLTSGVDANVLAAQRAEALAGLQADTERYVVVDVQRTVLRGRLEEFSATRANPLLAEAGEVLTLLTGGRWTGLVALDDGGDRRLAVRRADGELLEGAAGLSEGTADQVFLALRLAAVADQHRALVASGQGPLPVVLDDVLMTFDETRTRAALEALAELARDVQVVLLTHHADVAGQARELAAAGAAVSVTQLPAPSAVPTGSTGSAGGSGRRDRGGVDQQLVRAWAREQGHAVGDRGRVSEDLVRAYRAAHDLEETG
ncbi:histone-like nucleoid-structuring protein Lsr2 [Kineococcus sp. LSe6-4]|uniref:Histone-like nucleoid-structuring protein Lsr2 n=1 Tax=Kineococcus halophytocola TaxID=3234027 RepID=A0ABV4H3M6_9ACTN